MKDSDWKLILALHKFNNITRASEALYISQPSVTKRIQQIEDEFQVKIIDRNTKGIVFTPQGEYLITQVKKFTNLYEETKFKLLEMTDAYSDTLRIAAPNSFIAEMSNTLNDFRKKHENVIFDVKAELSSNIVYLVEQNKVHIGFINGDIELKEPFKQTKVKQGIAYVLSSHPIDINRLEQIPRIEHNRDPLTRRIIDSWWAENFHHPTVIGMNVNHQSTTEQMVASDFGYGVVFVSDESHLPDNLYHTKMTHKDGTPIIRNTWMLYSEEANKKEIFKQFVSYIRQTFANIN